MNINKLVKQTELFCERAQPVGLLKSISELTVSDNITRRESLFSFAAFLSRKQFLSQNPNKKQEVQFVFEMLSQKIGNKANKYFGIAWDAVSSSDNNNIKEVLDDAIEIFRKFEKFSKNLDKKDVNQYSSYKELNEVVNNFLFQKQMELQKKKQLKIQDKLENGVSADKVNQSLESGDNTKIYEDKEHIVYRVNTKEGAYALANDTPWCIARKNSIYFNQYVSSNEIFYFAIDKTLPLTDPYQKMAIRVMREDGNIVATRKTNDGDDNEPSEVPGWGRFESVVLQDAEAQPEAVLSKVKRGAASIEEARGLLQSYWAASIDDKRVLITYFKHYDLPEVRAVKSLLTLDLSEDQIQKLDLDSLDAATLERIAFLTEDEEILRKLYLTQYPSVQAEVTGKTSNIEIITAASFSTFEDVREEALLNPNNTNLELLNNFKDKDDERLEQVVQIKIDFLSKQFGDDYEKCIYILDKIGHSPDPRIAHLFRHLKNLTEDEYLRLIESVDGDMPYIATYVFMRYMIKNPSEKLQLAAVQQNGLAIQYIDKPTEAVQLAAVQQYGYVIEYIENPSEAVQLAAVQQAGMAIEGIENPSEAVQLAAVQRNGYAIEHIENPSEAVQLAAVQRHGYAIEYIENPSEAVQLAAIQQNGNAIDDIENPSEAVQLAAVQQYVDAIQYVENPSEAVQLAAVQQNIHSIQYIKNPSEAVQLTVVQLNGHTIEHIENPSEEVQLAAVQQAGRAIEHIENPSEEVQLAAVQQNVDAIKHIENPSEAVQLAAVQQNGYAIEHIENPSEAVQLAAVQQNVDAIGYIENPSEAVQLAAPLSNTYDSAYDVAMKDPNITLSEANCTHPESIISRNSSTNKTATAINRLIKLCNIFLKVSNGSLQI